MRLYVRLKLAVELPLRRLLPDLDPLRPVVADHAAPERVVQIQDERLFILSEYGLHDVRQVKTQRRDGRNRAGVFIHMPVKGIRPLIQPIAGGQIADILKIEVFVGRGIGAEAGV